MNNPFSLAKLLYLEKVVTYYHETTRIYKGDNPEILENIRMITELLEDIKRMIRETKLSNRSRGKF